jgi:hypothetical protein
MEYLQTSSFDPVELVSHSCILRRMGNLLHVIQKDHRYRRDTEQAQAGTQISD